MRSQKRGVRIQNGETAAVGPLLILHSSFSILHSSVQCPRDSRINTLPRGLSLSRGPAYVWPGRTRHSYRAEFSRSVINWSLVVITRLAAEKPVEEMIRFTNSFDRSTLLCSREPARTAPAPSSSGAEMIGTPLLPAATY